MYENQTGKPMKLDELLVMNQIVSHKKVSVSQLEAMPYISAYKLKQILDKLQELEFIEPTGKTSGQQYILHISKRKTTGEKIEYVLSKKQEKARQKEAILRYVDEVGSISNSEARQLLKLQDKDRSLVSRLLTSLVDAGELVILKDANSNKRIYGRKRWSRCRIRCIFQELVAKISNLKKEYNISFQ